MLIAPGFAMIYVHPVTNRETQELQQAGFALRLVRCVGHLDVILDANISPGCNDTDQALIPPLTGHGLQRYVMSRLCDGLQFIVGRPGRRGDPTQKPKLTCGKATPRFTSVMLKAFVQTGVHVRITS